MLLLGVALLPVLVPTALLALLLVRCLPGLLPLSASNQGVCCLMQKDRFGGLFVFLLYGYQRQ